MSDADDLTFEAMSDADLWEFVENNFQTKLLGNLYALTEARARFERRSADYEVSQERVERAIDIASVYLDEDGASADAGRYAVRDIVNALRPPNLQPMPKPLPTLTERLREAETRIYVAYDEAAEMWKRGGATGALQQAISDLVDILEAGLPTSDPPMDARLKVYDDAGGMAARLRSAQRRVHANVVHDDGDDEELPGLPSDEGEVEDWPAFTRNLAVTFHFLRRRVNLLEEAERTQREWNLKQAELAERVDGIAEDAAQVPTLGTELLSAKERIEALEAALDDELKRRQSENEQMRAFIDDRAGKLADRVGALEKASEDSDIVIAKQIMGDRGTISDNFEAVQREVESLRDLLAEHERRIDIALEKASGPRTINLDIDGVKINGKMLRIEEE